MKRYYYILLLPMLIALGCSGSQHISPKPLYCPEPQQNCNPARWSGNAEDTSEAYRKKAEYYHVFESMKQINTPENEWALSFLSDNRAALTFNDGEAQKVMLVRIIRENKGEIESGIGIPSEGSVGALSVRKNTIVYAATLPKENDVLGNSDLFIGELQGNIVNNARSLGDSVNGTHYSWESQPSISSDGNVIFFASDRNDNGVGGTDIWYSIKMPDGNWSSPINCGTMINTNCDELTPFVSEDGQTLLFSSAGHETIGGYDIFSSNISSRFWQDVKRYDIDALRNGSGYFTAAQNMGAPLNTPGDELFPSSPGNIDDLLYYSSNQSGTGSLLRRSGGFDIYLRRKVVPFRIAQDKKKEKDIKTDFRTNPDIDNQMKMPDLKVQPTYRIEGTVYNQVTRLPVPNAEISVKELQPLPQNVMNQNDTTAKTTGREHELEITGNTGDMFFESMKVNSDAKGKYSVTLKKDKTYQVEAQAEDLFFDTFKTRVDRDDTVTVIHRDLQLPVKLTLRINFPTNKFKDPYTYILDSSGIETNETWQEEITLLAKNILDTKDRIKKIILTGHTDDVSDVDYNYKLGQNRVNFVIEELVKRGVPEELLEGRSASKLEPLPKRKNENQQMYRKRLRRVELEKELI